ncbi:hypothetical protein LP123_11665 [Moraxella bovis]|uniref:hypothetical protein n=1 Tax=Moraxella bovis TaxID=476 RepID=UPI002225E2AD|nr:hypothetical protein [Moraxella bovis]UYZ80695.1 hypothetical protein LP113_11795 [Moraxella bovis]UYZ88967.1 hypothetical protein LP114_11110 [Moraxella bovis]UZA06729.1 hypothetical protein LP099_02630 [Moraxella bovis]UZA11043.1 hypothetical protein LP123_11665 [Moraxella bovis]UZA24376.1 hypothetical protein LP117_11565 [Moraxella bovis]
MLTKVEYPCPNCQNLFTPKALIKKPFKGALKPYQFTPEPAIHCPHCEQKLKAIFPVQYAWGLVGLVLLLCLMMIVQSIFDFQVNKIIENIIIFCCFLIAYWLSTQIEKQTYYEIDDD